MYKDLEFFLMLVGAFMVYFLVMLVLYTLIDFFGKNGKKSVIGTACNGCIVFINLVISGLVVVYSANFLITKFLETNDFGTKLIIGLISALSVATLLFAVNNIRKTLTTKPNF